MFKQALRRYKKDILFWIIRWGGDEFVVVMASTQDFKSQERKEINSWLGDEIHNIFYKNKNDFIEAIKNWGQELCKDKTEEDINNVLNNIGIAGGWSWCNNEDNDPFKSARDNAEKAMYVAKVVSKGPLLGQRDCVALEYTDEIEKYRGFPQKIAETLTKNNQ